MGSLTALSLLLITLGLCHCQYDKQPKLYRGGATTSLYAANDDSFNWAWYSVEDREAITFRVRSCSNAMLVLSTYMEYTSPNSTEVILGRYDNSASVVRSVLDYSRAYMTYTPDILHCNDFRSFWVKWSDNVIVVGTGPIVGSFPFMSWTDYTKHKINAVAITNGYSSSATWEMAENTGHMLNVHTPEDYRYQYMWKNVERRSFMAFDVRACNDVHIALARAMGHTQRGMYEIVIGGWSNTQSVIRRGVQTDNLAVASTPNIVDCTEHRSFWVSWLGRTVLVGRGAFYLENVFLNLTQRQTPPIRFFGISTGWGSLGNWYFEDTLETTTVVRTVGTNQFQTVWAEAPRKQAMVFSVRACSDAQIAFASNRGSLGENDILVVIGAEGNTRSGVKAPFMAGWRSSNETRNILNCDSFRYFWITWDRSLIRVGTGFIYNNNQIIQLQDTFHEINAIGFDTPNNVEAIFRFRESVGERVYVTTPPAPIGYNTLWRTFDNEMNWMMFQIKSPANMHVILTTAKGSTTDEALNFVIGGWDNTRSVVRPGFQGPELAAKDTPGILSNNEFRSFWLSWFMTRVQFGRGTVVRQQFLFNINARNSFPFNAVGLSTGYGSQGEWLIEEDNGDFMRVNTNDTHQYGANWFTISKTTQLVFKIRSCSDTHLMICKDRNQPTQDRYEFIIGGWNNTKSAIRTPDNALQVQVDTPSITSCQDFRPFWVSWANGQIQMGQGHVPMKNPVMSWQDPNPVSSIGFASATTGYDGKFGEWELMTGSVADVEFQTSDNYGYLQWRSTEHRDSVTFGIQACSDVHIGLTPFLGFPNPGYELVIGGWNNGQSVVRDASTKYHYATVATPDILSCTEFRWFWISWYNGEISVGRGNNTEYSRFLYWQDLVPRPIRAVGYSTGYGNRGTYKHSLEYIKAAPPQIPEVPIPTRETPTPSAPQGLSGGQKAGIAIGVIIALALIVGVVVFLGRAGVVKPPTMDTIRNLKERVGGALSRSSVPHDKFENPTSSDA